MTRNFVRFGVGIGWLAASWLVTMPQPAHATYWRDFARSADSSDRYDRADGKDSKPDGDSPKPGPRHGGGSPRPTPRPGPQDGGDR